MIEVVCFVALFNRRYEVKEFRRSDFEKRLTERVVLRKREEQIAQAFML